MIVFDDHETNIQKNSHSFRVAVVLNTSTFLLVIWFFRQLTR